MEEDPEKISELLERKKNLRSQQLRLPAKSQTDKCLKYIRYADDFIIGINGSKEECEALKLEIKEFLAFVGLRFGGKSELLRTKIFLSFQ